MTALVDTSVIVRYLTGDPPPMAARAARILDARSAVQVTDVVIAETAFVLSSVYGIPRAAIVDTLLAFLQKRNVAVLGLPKATVTHGLLLCRPSNRVSFADAMVWAAARSSRTPVVYSFDERFPDDGVTVRRDASPS